MAVIEGDQAFQRLAAILQDREDPDDKGPLAEVSDHFNDLSCAMRAYVERTGKACKGQIVFTINLKGFRTKGKEVGMEVETGVTHKAPPKPKRGTMLYLDHEGTAHTAPVQEDLPIFNAKVVIQGGKGQDETGDVAKKATV